jgi:integrase
MARPKNTVPTYRLHSPSQTARCWVAGRWLTLGKYNSPESRAENARILAELAVTPIPAAVGTTRTPDVTVNELLVGFWRFAEQHYRHADGTTTNELPQFRQTFRLVRELYGHTPATEFGPLALKALRQKMIEAGWNRKLINQRVGRVRRVFRWAAENELIPVAVYQALATVAGLQAGRTQAKETGPVGPVADEHVRATLPFLRPALRAMVGVQLLTGMRPGEVCQLRPCDLDTSGEVWLFRPTQHKGQHRNKPRVVAIGPRAKVLLSDFAPADPADFFFSPRRVVEQLHAERSANRKTPRYPSHMRRSVAKCVGGGKPRHAARYNVTSYGRAVARAVERANRELARKAAADGVPFELVPHWQPIATR